LLGGRALLDHPVRPRLVAVCDLNEDALRWFDQIESVSVKVSDYREILADEEIDVVYIAVRHDLHEQMYVDTVSAGKDLLAEKPFGIDLPAAERIAAAGRKSGSFVRCSSEMPFYPGAQRAIELVQSGQLGRIIEVRSSFCHSSDLDPQKPINWKRRQESCGEAGVMNDLGMHVVHVPLRLGWCPNRVFAVLQDLVAQRPGADGELVRCDTFDNATLLTTVEAEGDSFPMTLEMKRIAPGQKNTWSFTALGMTGGVSYSTLVPKDCSSDGNQTR